MKQSPSKYDANFTAGGLLLNEFLAIEPLLLSDNFDEMIKTEIEENQIIGIATNSARKRIIAEIKRRVEMAPEGFWEFFYPLGLKEQKLALFYLCLKTYPLIFDIHFEVALKKFKIGGKMNDYDIQMKIDEIASGDTYVASWSETTFKKINVQYRKVLREVELYKQEQLQKCNLYNPTFWEYFKEHGESWFLEACFITV